MHEKIGELSLDLQEQRQLLEEATTTAEALQREHTLREKELTALLAEAENREQLLALTLEEAQLAHEENMHRAELAALMEREAALGPLKEELNSLSEENTLLARKMQDLVSICCFGACARPSRREVLHCIHDRLFSRILS